MFPLQIHLPFAILFYFSLYLLIQFSQGIVEFQLNKTAVFGCITVFGIMLLLRILDEFKDVGVDEKLFSHRPLITGKVKYKDLRVLGVLVFLGISVLNILLGGKILLFYFFAVVYLGLTFKWFFIEKSMRDNLILTLISHQPITLFINLYIVSTALQSHNISNYPLLILCILGFFFPIFAWETSRKIRPIGGETDYVTYSKLFGPVKASFLPLIALSLYFAALVLLAINLKFDFWLYPILITIYLLALIAYVRFMLVPNKKRMILKHLTEYSIFISLFAMLLYLIL